MTAVAMRTDELTRLREKYPDWHIWLSSAQRVWATRRGNIKVTVDRDPRTPKRDTRWFYTVDADTPEMLDAVLELQDEL